MGAFGFVAILIAMLTPLSVSAQVSDMSDEEIRAEWEAARERERERHRSFALECDTIDPHFTEEAYEALQEGQVTDRDAFECDADWIRIEHILKPVLPLIGAQGYYDFEEPEGSVDTIAIRNVSIAYSSISLIRSVECHFARGEPSYERVAIGGTARNAQLRRWRNDQDLSVWTLEISASDCEFLLNTMKNYEPEDIIHDLPFGSPIQGNEIILVHGSSFTEFLDESGDYVLVLRPGLHGPADLRSEETEAVLRNMANYFAHRAEAEGVRTLLDPADFGYEVEED